MKKLVILFGIASLLFGLTCCKKASDETIVLLGKEAYVIPMNTLIPDTLQTKIPTLLGGTPEGFIPPNIEGEYVINPKQYCYSNFIDLSDTLDMHLRISQQHNRVARVEFFEGETILTDTAYIMGSGQQFTLYFKEKRNLKFFGSQSLVTRCVIITGTKTDQGIDNLYFGNVILEAKEGSNPFIGTFVPGWYFIYKDGNGKSENGDWFDHQQEEGEEK